jgi:disulfide bond formation protein DsbB
MLLYMHKIRPQHALIFSGLVAAVALAAALVGQYGFDLHPCHLCILQRYPFAIIIGLSLAGVWVKRLTLPLLGLSAVAYGINAVIAFYHSGVERRLWAGLDGCSTPDMSGSVEDLMARIQSTDVVRCDEIPWDILGITMANMNVALCAFMAIVICFYWLTVRPKLR